MIEIEIFNVKGQSLGHVSAQPSTKIYQLKNEIGKLKKAPKPERQSIRTDSHGKSVKEDATIQSLNLQTGSKLYVKDLGPQIGWKTVFLVEYAGPLFLYLWMFGRPWLFYGDAGKASLIPFTVKAACVCWVIHYAKRLLETLFVHRFSHATMPLRNLFKNCSYYWLFAMYIAYYVNHPLFTEPHFLQVAAGLGLFTAAELGNLSIHLALRNLRPPGTTTRKIPVPTGNPFTILFEFVSCPNYFYEYLAWVGFTIMTSCLPAGLFALAGMYQMTIWALGKHKAYRKEFPNYPSKRKAIIPFIL